MPSYAPDDFLISGSNREAYEWVTQPQRWNAYGLRVAGPPGSGRTHLAHVWAQKQGASFVTLPAADLSSDAVLDDLFAHGDEAAIFHLLNRVRDSGRKILLVCDEAAPATQFRLPDLLSRLNALPQVQLHQPDDDLLAAVLRKQMADRQLRVQEEVIAYLAPRMERSFAAIAQMAKLLDEEALQQRKAVTLGLAKDAIARLKR